MRGAVRLSFVVLFVAGILPSTADVTWWSMALQSLDTWRGGGGGGRAASSTHAFVLGGAGQQQPPICRVLEGLSAGQARICQLYPDHMASVARGAQLGVSECKYQLQWRRWNCSTTNDSAVFGPPITATGSRESAFVHAISAAGVVYAVSRACRDAQLSTCGCSRRPRPTRAAVDEPGPSKSAGGGGKAAAGGAGQKDGADDWLWGGCGDNTDYGYKFAQGFIDVREREKNYPRHSAGLARMLMNVHNNEAGRLAVYNYARVACKCHGVSGSCNLRTCWHQLPAFREVGDRLRVQYDSAAEATFNRPGTFLVRGGGSGASTATSTSGGKSRRTSTGVTSRKNRRRVLQRRGARLTKEELMFVEPSPDYCERDDSSSTPGTHGRRCERGPGIAATDPRSCDLLCCGRGYNAFRSTIVERCRCRFQWCCEVKCSACERTVDMYVCK